MPYTRLQVETFLVGPDLVSGRRGAICARAMLFNAGAVALGTVPALAGPITRSLTALGSPPLDPLNPADADIASLSADLTSALLDLSDMFLLEWIVGNWVLVDQKISMGGLNLGQFGDRLERELMELRKEAKIKYGYGLSSPVLGTTDLGFAASQSPYWTSP